MARTKKTTERGGVEEAVSEARRALGLVKSALAVVGLARLTAEERRVSPGRLREDETSALATILDTVDAHPELFVSLADRDGGQDPHTLETAPARAALARLASFEPLAADLEALLTSVSDDRLASAAFVKSVTVPAYGIAKANAPVNPKLRKSIAGALDFYGKGARTRAAKKTK